MDANELAVKLHDAAMETARKGHPPAPAMMTFKNGELSIVPLTGYLSIGGDTPDVSRVVRVLRAFVRVQDPDLVALGLGIQDRGEEERLLFIVQVQAKADPLYVAMAALTIVGKDSKATMIEHAELLRRFPPFDLYHWQDLSEEDLEEARQGFETVPPATVH